ncbi:hypothetical protein ACW4YW_02195 [Methylobacillus pratensis]
MIHPFDNSLRLEPVRINVSAGNVYSFIWGELLMAVYFLSYDLRRNKRDYQKLYDELKKYKAVQVLESVYAFKYEEKKSTELSNHFKSFIDSDDGLLVIEEKDWSGIKIKNSPNPLY